MSGRGTIQADGTPARVLGYLREHPDSTAVAAISALQLPKSEVYNALRRLESLDLVEQTCRGSRSIELARWSPRGESSPRLALAPLRGLSPWVMRWTGVPIASVRQLRKFTVR